jgi:hypothetical protein
MNLFRFDLFSFTITYRLAFAKDNSFPLESISNAAYSRPNILTINEMIFEHESWNRPGHNSAETNNEKQRQRDRQIGKRRQL